MAPLAFLSGRASLFIGVFLCLAQLLSAQPASAPGEQVMLVLGEAVAAAVRHGIDKLKLVLEQKGARMQEVNSISMAANGTVVVAGLTTGQAEAARLIADLRHTPRTEPESLLIRKFNRDGKHVMLASGADARGLMYALLNVADRVVWVGSEDGVFSEVRDVQEEPYTPERALSIYTFNRAYWESRLYAEADWARFLDVLAQNRFNSPVVIFGYENGGTARVLWWGNPEFAQAFADIAAQVAEAEKRIGNHRNREFDSTVTDLKILANLALFYARRIPAAVNYRLFDRTKDSKALDPDGNGRIHPDLNLETPDIVVKLQR